MSDYNYERLNERTIGEQVAEGRFHLVRKARLRLHSAGSVMGVPRNEVTDTQSQAEQAPSIDNVVQIETQQPVVPQTAHEELARAAIREARGEAA